MAKLLRKLIQILNNSPGKPASGIPNATELEIRTRAIIHLSDRPESATNAVSTESAHQSLALAYQPLLLGQEEQGSSGEWGINPARDSEYDPQADFLSSFVGNNNLTPVMVKSKIIDQAFIASHPSFHVFRRFCRVRARLLLIKQDELSLLERQLDEIDAQEDKELFLGNRRRDKNPERKEILSKLEENLASYDAMLEHNRAIFAAEVPQKRDLANLQNWLDNKASVARDETAYLFKTQDLMTVHSPRDDTLSRLTPLAERLVSVLCRLLKKPRSTVSQDPNLTLLSESVLQRLTRAIVGSAVVLLLLVPIVIINAVTVLALRMMVIVVASALLITALSTLTNAKTVEVFMSGAT
ncbi:MAG: hypothetical protein Q9202_004428 [Teloschistes flavicans]